MTIASSGQHPVAACGRWCGVVVVLVLLTPDPAEAYIGPGAGFAFLSSFLALVATGLIAVLTFVVWPFRKAWQFVRRPRRARAFARRLIVVGFDGQDSDVTERYLSEDKLPNLRKLADAGSHRRLHTAQPGRSEDGWAAFSVGAFATTPPASTFWSVLGAHGVWSTILCVPAVLPIRKFYGAQLGIVAAKDAGQQPRFVSHPAFYTKYLTTRLGKVSASELAGPAEREAMFLSALDRLRFGVLVCVFDDDDHERSDAFLGRLMPSLRQDDLLIVVVGSGLVFSNRRIDADHPALVDLAPTALRTFGVTPPAHMTGTPLFSFATSTPSTSPVGGGAAH